jgi:hypothetical protein
MISQSMIDKFTDSLEFEDVRALREMYTVRADESSGEMKEEGISDSSSSLEHVMEEFSGRGQLNAIKEHPNLLCDFGPERGGVDVIERDTGWPERSAEIKRNFQQPHDTRCSFD